MRQYVLVSTQGLFMSTEATRIFARFACISVHFTYPCNVHRVSIYMGSCAADI